jgi:excinuclease UvrABC helicase subunit UvrB
MKTMKPFKLHTSYDPKGSQPKAIKQLVKGINKGFDKQTLLGVTGSGKTLTMAYVVEKIQRPTIVIKPLLDNSIMNSNHYSQIIVLNILFPIMIIINQNPTFQNETYTLKRMQILIQRLNK